MTYKAICKSCKNDLLQIYFTEESLGARCPKCKEIAFVVANNTLMQMQGNLPLKTPQIYIRTKEEIRKYRSKLPPRVD